VFGFTWLAVRLGLGTLPAGIRWSHVFGVALLTGIGFTMSLFIGSLAFPTTLCTARCGWVYCWIDLRGARGHLVAARGVSASALKASGMRPRSHSAQCVPRKP
jgi:hypothetical protein